MHDTAALTANPTSGGPAGSVAVGTAALIKPIHVAPAFLGVDLWVAVVTVAILIPFGLAGGRLPRWSGAMMIALWVAYTAWRVIGDLSI